MPTKPRRSRNPRANPAPHQRPPLPTDLPPLIRLADCHTNRRKGRYGHTPYSRGTLAKLIAEHQIETVKLGPRTTCLTRETVLRLQEGELLSAELAKTDLISAERRAKARSNDAPT